MYELCVEGRGAYHELNQKEPSIVFFSNLSKTLETLVAHLAMNHWETDRVNYSAVYRSIQAKGKFWVDFNLVGAKLFRVTITKRILNPNITSLGIEEKPMLKKGTKG